jgi:hypothetical protein
MVAHEEKCPQQEQKKLLLFYQSLSTRLVLARDTKHKWQ